MDDVSEYLDENSEKYKRMIEWIAMDLGVTTLRYQTVEDMVEAVGRPKEELCLYCWTGECPKSTRPKAGRTMNIVEVKPDAAKKTETKVEL